MKSKFVPALGLTAALALSTLTAATSATAADSVRTGGTVSSGTSGLSAGARALDRDPQKALEKYWSPARMAAARPADKVIAGKPAANGMGVDRAAKGRPGSVAPTAAAGSARTNPLRLPGTYPTWGPNQFTARTIGKVFFTDPRNGGSYVCSANVVNSEGKSTVWTAGHCVSAGDGSTWMQNWVFVPAYKNGNRPWGTWASQQLWTTSSWFYDGNFSNDIGAVIMKRRNGVRIVDKLGGQGLKWNWSDLPYVVALGYPHAYPFNGQRLYRVNGYTYAYGADRYMTNNMTGGSSGGEWLRDFSAGVGYINGHNDYKYSSMPQYMFSPYYGDNAGDLYNAVRNLSS